jgi:hypothetical protein
MVSTVIPLSRCSQCDEDEGHDFRGVGRVRGAVRARRFCGPRAPLRRWPDDVNAPYDLGDLGDAYVRNGQPERAIEFLTPAHRADPKLVPSPRSELLNEMI